MQQKRYRIVNNTTKPLGNGFNSYEANGFFNLSMGKLLLKVIQIIYESSL
jgi:hypothetical protein